MLLGTSKSPDIAVIGASEFEALGDRMVYSLLVALLVSFALNIGQSNVAGPQDFQRASLLERYFNKRMGFISSRDFLTVIVLHIAVLMVIFNINPSDADGMVFLCYLFSMVFMVGMMKFAFNTVRKMLACGQWFLLPPDAVCQLREHFPRSIVFSAIYRPPCLL